MPKTAWKAFIKAIGPQKYLVIAMWFLILAGHFIAFTLPYILKNIVDYVNEVDNVGFSDLSTYIILIIAVLVGQELSYRTAHLLEVLINNGVVTRVNCKFTPRCPHLPTV